MTTDNNPPAPLYDNTPLKFFSHYEFMRQGMHLKWTDPDRSTVDGTRKILIFYYCKKLNYLSSLSHGLQNILRSLLYGDYNIFGTDVNPADGDWNRNRARHPRDLEREALFDK